MRPLLSRKKLTSTRQAHLGLHRRGRLARAARRLDLAEELVAVPDDAPQDSAAAAPAAGRSEVNIRHSRTLIYYLGSTATTKW